MTYKRFRAGRILSLIAIALTLVLGSAVVSNAIQVAIQAPAEESAGSEAGDTVEVGTQADAEGEIEIDEARLVAGLEIYKEANCRGCHGWAANGVREGPNPQGPSLRASMLPAEALHLTIACGRPGTEMPYFWRDAYRRDSTECYGQTADQLGDLEPIRAGVRFTTEEIDDLVYYLANYVQGLGEITQEQCFFFYGADSTRCDAYPTDAELAAEEAAM